MLASSQALDFFGCGKDRMIGCLSLAVGMSARLDLLPLDRQQLPGILKGWHLKK